MSTRNARFFGDELYKQIMDGTSQFHDDATANGYWQQTLNTLSSEGSSGGRGYAGEVVLALMLHLPRENSHLTIRDFTNYPTFEELKSLYKRT